MCPDIDDLIADQEEHEGKSTGTDEKAGPKKVAVGTVERFFDKINVVAILLSRDVKVGDMIEMEGDEGRFVMKISSMQINRNDVQKATEGDSVGIKTDRRVVAGSDVYIVS